MYYKVSEIYIGGRFFIATVFIATPNKLHLLYLKSLWFPMILHKEHQKHKNFNILALNASPKPNLLNTAQFIEQ